MAKEETEETAKSSEANISRSEILQTHPFSNTIEPLDRFIGWLLTDLALSLRLFADLKIPNIVETPLNTQSSS